MSKLKTIYEPSGRANEYSPLALNYYIGCGFGCTYCFAPMTLKKDRENYKKADFISLRANILDKVKRDCEILNKNNDKRRVLLSFVSDPYQDLDLELETTRKILEIFKKYNISFQILTKGGMRASRDFDLYKTGDAFASTLTFISPEKSLKYEPYAPIPEDRFNALKLAKSKGIETWASLEPVIEPEETLEIIKNTYSFIDFYKVGKLNYDELEKTIDWRDFALKAISLLEKYNKKYYIKNDLKSFI